MSQKLQNAQNLYLEGIRDGNIEVVKKYTGERYTQHSTGVEDGPEGFMAFFKGFLERTNSRDIQVIRAIEDGRYVFVHVYQDIDNGTAKWVTTDLFDTDSDDKIVEHWDVIAAYQEPEDTASGNDMILGNFELKDLDKTEENKALIRNLLVEVFQNGHLDALDKYVSSEKYIQHNPHLPDGIEALREFLSSHDLSYDFVFNVIGQGDHVVSYSKATYEGQEMAVFDIFRIENGKIVEQWDNMEPIPPRTEWANTGKF
ncbi:SnoaL-like domain protein [Grimontia celer]|uniref:SnoaL-like domain protein n=1 Tax=Grimontia celer TaxID=1796497 RepID=A0A128EXT3_9GAMM|nr:nuclear transport factor 2 family protein [Grimontia celer]CZF78964.1 SnoaL-like domain protein [Grimontia celer]